jgi:glutamate 5-kinase
MKRVVLKVGSAVVGNSDSLASDRIENLVKLIKDLRSKYEVILVSSGAVIAGYTLLQLDKSDVSNKQALAAIGQPLLMKYYKELFSSYDIKCAQLLLTADDFDSRKRTTFAKDAIERLLENGVTPIINENDVTATQELIFGDNDQLASAVTHYFDADMLVILSDIDGYYDKNPSYFSDANMLKRVSSIDPKSLVVVPDANSEFATGGIVTKLKAADFLLKKGSSMFLTSGFNLSYAREFLLHNNHDKGTLFQV